MFISKTKKYAFTGLGLTLLAFLLLVLAGCNATSDPKVSYQATGSWQGTIKNPIAGTVDQVRGLIAPDGSYHLAIVAEGNSVGAYVGRISFIDTENVGNMTLQRLQGNESSGNPLSITFKLSADRLYSLQGIELKRTPDANGPAVQSAVAGHWSLSALDNTTEVIINADGSLGGSDGSCNYSGSLELKSPSWNIYRFVLTVSDYAYLSSCSLDKGTYDGLAMLLNVGDPRPRLWFAANSLAKTFLGEWSETDNDAPVAKMTILGERPDQSVLVQEGAAVELDGQDSSDANNDLLTYAWSGVDFDGNALTMTIAPDSGSTATFIPVKDGIYSLTLTVNDGIVSNTLVRQLGVEWTPDRFIGCGNGTVLDTKSNLLWLQDAGCLDLNLDVAANLWGFSAPVAQERVKTVADGVCALTDNSAPGDWGLPKVDEFRQIVTTTPFAVPPALLNGQGTGQWSDGDIFVNVGATNILDNELYIYWTAEPDLDPVAPNNWLFVDFNYDVPENWKGSQFAGTINSLWPVRALRTNPTNPELNEQCPSVP